MSLNKKRLSIIGAGVAVAGVVIGGVAFAAFRQSADVSTTGSGTEKFESLTVTGTWLGREVGGNYSASTKLLLPGESGDVRVTLTNPSSNTVQGKVVSIIPGALQQDGCTSSYTVASYTPGTDLVLKNGSTVSVTLKKAVTLNESATEACQGQTFPTNFKVSFEATRDAVKTTQILNPDTAPAAQTGA